MRHGLRPRALCLLIIAVALAHALLLLIPGKPTPQSTASTLELVLAHPAQGISPPAARARPERRRPAPPAPAKESAPMHAPVTSESIQTAPAHHSDSVAMTRSIESHAPQTESRPVTGTEAASTAPLQAADFRAASLGNRPADYPRLARQRGWQGQVVLKVRVSASGKASDILVETSSGHELLDEAAIEAVRSWRFSPARRGDNPLETWVRVPVDFRLGTN